MSQQLQDLYKQFVSGDDTPPEYGLIYFDHLSSEYRIIRHRVDPEAQTLLDDILSKRESGEINWNDLYTFDLMLLDYLSPEYLVRKAFSLRARYRNIAGQLAYDAYILSKPPDIGSLNLNETASPPTLGELNEIELKADIRFLLSEIHLLYAVMPTRETMRGYLIKRTMYALVSGLIILVLATLLIHTFTPIRLQLTTLAVVALVGVVGGFLSVLQRIQSSPSEGDAIYNLAAITHNTWSIYISPFSGGIFAILLFIIFAAGILQGTIIPKLSPTQNPNTGQNAAGGTPATETQTATTSGAQPSATPVTTGDTQATAKAAPVPVEALSVNEFLRVTGPRTSWDYALLMLWSFLAGFAERLVPDTLNRLVAKQQLQSGQT
jgi:hypothetical protein